jgi:hypothetical protein
MTSATYPITLEHATDIIIELRLSQAETIIESSRRAPFLLRRVQRGEDR